FEFRRKANRVSCSDNCFLPEARRTRNIASLEEVIAHQTFCRLASFGMAITKLRGDLFLGLDCQHVGITRRIKMKTVPNAVKEPHSMFRYRMPVARFQRLAPPAAPVHITQTAWRFLDVGLKLINRVAELFVPNRLHLREQFEESISILLNETRHDFA